MKTKQRRSAQITCRSLSEREKATYKAEINVMEVPKTLKNYCLTTKNNDIALKLIRENSELLKEFMI